MPKVYNSFGEPSLPPTGYTYGVVEGAICVWEEMLSRIHPSGGPKDPALSELFGDLGSFEMRAHATAIAAWAEPIWKAGFDEASGIPFDSYQFDWHFIPAILDMVGWQNGCSIVPAGTPEQLVPIVLERMAPKPALEAA